MSLEDDYGMIDGVINNGKASVLEQLQETNNNILMSKLTKVNYATHTHLKTD